MNASTRTALVTAGSGGILRGISSALLHAGYDVVLTYRSTPPAAELRDCESYAVDFDAEPAAIGGALEKIVERHSIDVLIHGVGPMTVKRFERSGMDDYDAMLNGNLRSAVLASAAVLPTMRERKFGRLIFFAMNHSDVTQPVRGLSLHAAAKSGLVAFAKTLALEEAKYGITVNVVAPGDIREKDLSRADARKRHAANPVGRPGSWEDVSDAVLFLVRDDADFINGAFLNVNGGLAEPYERTAKPS